jgi:transmembrane sensor
MEMQNDLFLRYMNNECTVREINELLDHFNIAEDEKKLKAVINAELNREEVQVAYLEEDEQALDSRLSDLYSRLKQDIAVEAIEKVKVRSLSQWYGIAAAIAIFCCVGLGFLHSRLKQKEPQTAVAYVIKPGGNKATLVLSDGKQVDLLQAKNGVLAQQGLVSISKTADGQLSYSTPVSADTKSIGYNIIQVPKGGQYQVTLPDGTHIWLNSASTLSYPINFNGKTRNVTLSGEAYFEVAKNKDQPFMVNVNDVVVQVFGTHFNIMAYADEPSINTTLLEGSVKVSKGRLSQMIVPGQQARISKDIQIVKANIDEAVAWKNADFLLVNSDIQPLMRKIERWYNVKVVYTGEMPTTHLNGEIPRNTDLKKLLGVLEQMGGVHFKIEQNVIRVSK